MDQDMEQQVYLKQYMLGDLDEEKRRQIEERLLTDGDYFSELLVVEDELVDDYVTNSLSAHEHE